MTLSSTVSPQVPAHSITALRYRLHSGPVDLAPLVIRQVKAFDWGQARVTAYVLGASHAVYVALPDGREFTELLTCLPPRSLPSAPGSALNTFPVPDFVHAPVMQDIEGLDGVRGTVRLSRFSLMTPGTDEIAGAFAPENALHEPFLLPNGDIAWTRIAWRIDGPTLRVETIHTYPDDGAGVRSATDLCLLNAD